MSSLQLLRSDASIWHKTIIITFHKHTTKLPPHGLQTPGPSCFSPRYSSLGHHTALVAETALPGRNTVSKPLSSSATASSRAKQAVPLQRAQSTNSTPFAKSSANASTTKISSISRTASAGANTRPKSNTSKPLDKPSPVGNCFATHIAFNFLHRW